MIFSRHGPHNLAFILLSENNQCFHTQPMVGQPAPAPQAWDEGRAHGTRHSQTRAPALPIGGGELDSTRRARVKQQTSTSSSSQHRCRRQWLFFPDCNWKCSCGTAAWEARTVWGCNLLPDTLTAFYQQSLHVTGLAFIYPVLENDRKY